MLALKITISVLMAIVGGAKVLGAKPLADQFEEFGLPRIVMILVGLAELAAGVGVHVPTLAFAATCGLALLMVGALVSHLRVEHPPQSLAPAALVLVLAVVHSALTWPAL